ncbi:MAG: hypothetical protein IT432_15520 [Phycisphaerales bacterium]|nr:hypothetical protein [Phycisphaerales bacterium]
MLTRGEIPAVVFDDSLGQIGTLTHTRPAFDIRTGALTNLERLAALLDLRVIALRTPDSLAPTTAERYAKGEISIPVNTLVGTDIAANPDQQITLVSGRCTLPPIVKADSLDAEPLDAKSLASLPLNSAITDAAGAVLAIRVDARAAAAFLAGALIQPANTIRAAKSFTLDRPWSIRAHRDAALAVDLRLLPERLLGGGHAKGATIFGDARLHIHPSAKVYPGATFDLEHGPIIIDEHAVVRPGAIVIGPVFIGAHAIINEHATIRGQTSIGPWCKVGGEVGGTIFQAFSNKGHDGYLGDSYLGEWVNLGAATNNSNLLNTYGEIIAKATPHSSNERTGQQFLGCMLGDHVKTAIGTRIMTGSIVGTGSMWAATEPVSGCVDAFTWRTDAGARAYRFEKFIEVARAMMSRRAVTPSEAYMELLKDLSSPRSDTEGHGGRK